MNTKLLDKVLEVGLYEYGHECCPLKSKWAPYIDGEIKAKRLIVAYNNADYTYATLPMFKTDADLIVSGIKTVCEAFDIGEAVIYLPETACEDIVTAVKAYPLDIKVELGRVVVQDTDETDLIHHPETIANIARVLSAGEPQYTVLVRRGDVEKTVSVTLGSSVGDMLNAAGMTADKDTTIIIGGLFGTMVKGGAASAHMYGLANSVIDVFDGKFCVVSFAQKASEYAAENTCGRCTFCREGNRQLAAFLKNAVSGHGGEEDMGWIRTLAEAVKEEGVCSFGKESTAFIAETIASHNKSYYAHIRGKRCDADVCQSFTDYAVDGSLCVGCDKCRQVCEYGAITDEPGYIHRIDTFDCTKCGKCAEVCPEKAIYKVRVGRLIGPTKSTKVGRFRSSRKRY